MLVALRPPATAEADSRTSAKSAAPYRGAERNGTVNRGSDAKPDCVQAGGEASTVGGAAPMHLLCVSPYPHLHSHRPTNHCLYWLGTYSDGRFDLDGARGRWTPLQIGRCPR
jgi:hypothetical protein